MAAAGAPRRTPQRAVTCGASSSGPRATPLLAVETARALGRGRGRGRSEPARVGAARRSPRCPRCPRARRAGGSRRGRGRCAELGPAPAGRIPTRPRPRRCRAGPAGRRRRRHRVSPRAAARRRLRGDRRAAPARAAPRLGRRAASGRAGRRDPAAGRGRRVTSGSPAPTPRPSRSSSAPPPTPARSRRLEQAIAYLDEALAIAPDRADAVARAAASSRRGGSVAIRQRWRSSVRWRCSRNAEPLGARARPGCGGARLPRSDLRPARCARERRAPRSSCSTERPAGAGQSAARRSPRGRGQRRSPASVDEAERLLLELSAGPHAGGDLLHLRRRPRSCAGADAARPVRRVVRAVDRRRRGDRPRRPAGPRVRVLGERRQRRPCRRRARARARVPRSRDRRRSPVTGCRASRSTCWPSVRSCCAVWARLEEARAAADAERALAERLGQPELRGDGEPRPRTGRARGRASTR